MHAILLDTNDEHKWNDFAYSHPYSSIHQTTRWAHFQSNVPSRDKFWIIAIQETVQNDKDDDKQPKQAKQRDQQSIKNETNKIVAGTILIKHTLPNEKYCWLYSPRGPLLDYDEPNKAKAQLKILTQKIREIAKEEKAIFYRIDPLIHKTKHNKNALNFPKFHFSKGGFQPKDTLILDLNQTQDEILEQMKQKGRYNIRLAQKKNVKVVEVIPPALKSNKKTIELVQTFQDQVESYFNLLQETLERDRFYGHRLAFYKNMVEKLSPESNTLTKENLKKELKQGYAKLYLAEYTPKETHKTQYIAGIIVTFFKDTAIYYYGASSNEYRNVMAPYALQWHAIKEAKSLGCTEFDFLGIAPAKGKDPLGPKNHPWRGVTAFKLKFGGTHVHYLPAQELIFKPLLYTLYKVVKFVRKFFR